MNLTVPLQLRIRWEAGKVIDASFVAIGPFDEIELSQAVKIALTKVLESE